MLLALLYNRAGKWSKARDQVYSLLGRMPKNPVVLANWIQMLLEHDEVQNLDKWMEKLEEAAPKSDQTIQLKLRWLAKQEKTQEATDYVKGLVSDLAEPAEPLKPEQVAMLAKVGTILEELKDYSDAEKYMRQWYENEPGQTLAFAAFLGSAANWMRLSVCSTRSAKKNSLRPAHPKRSARDSHQTRRLGERRQI